MHCQRCASDNSSFECGINQNFLSPIPCPARVAFLMLNHQKTRGRSNETEALQNDLYRVLNDIWLTIERLASEHNKPEVFILEQLHLGGTVLKQKDSVGINNTYTNCEAWCNDIYKLIS